MAVWDNRKGGRHVMVSPLRFGLHEAQAAADAWGFNCGPGALCAVLGMTPAELRPHLFGFEKKGCTNPGLMALILQGLGVRWKPVFECTGAREPVSWVYPRFGLVRVQWSGPWTRPGVPVRARYRHTHWIAIDCGEAAPATLDERTRVFDINAIADGGWCSWPAWANQLVPWLLRRAVPRADGRWWPTHCWEVRKQLQHHGSSHVVPAEKPTTPAPGRSNVQPQPRKRRERPGERKAEEKLKRAMEGRW